MSIREDRLSCIRVAVARAIGLTPADMADEVDLLTTFAANVAGPPAIGHKRRENRWRRV